MFHDFPLFIERSPDFSQATNVLNRRSWNRLCMTCAVKSTPIPSHYTRWQINIAIENGHLYLIYLSKIIILHTYVKLPEDTSMYISINHKSSGFHPFSSWFTWPHDAPFTTHHDSAPVRVPFPRHKDISDVAEPVPQLPKNSVRVINQCEIHGSLMRHHKFFGKL